MLKRWLFYTHRWLGIICSVFFAVWFASGIVMIYARMPRLTAEERLMRLPVLDATAIRVTPADAVAAADYTAGAPPDRMRVSMLADRPVYRFARGPAWQTVYADTGEPLSGFSAETAVHAVSRFVPEQAATLHYGKRLTDSDQWTLSSIIRAQMPMHRVALGDAAGTHLYLSDRTGDVVMKTDARGRFWGYAGAVMHWIYFTPVRRHAQAWNHFIVYFSLVGCVVCFSGLAAGSWRWSRTARFRLRGSTAPSRSPYAGMMRWHHYGGLLFGVVSFTWILSGLFSMNPFNWSPGSSPTADQRRLFALGTLDVGALSLDDLRSAVRTLSAGFPLKEVEVVRFAGEQFYSAFRAPAADAAGQWSNTDLAAFLSPQTAMGRQMVGIGARTGVAFTLFDRAAIERATRAAMPHAKVVEVV